MSGKTAIQWATDTWNPVTGCSRVSEGCRHCYAETLSHRFGYTTLPWTHVNAAKNVVLHPERLKDPATWRKPRRIFVNSMSDLWHEQVPGSFINDVWMVMRNAKQHTYLILTKRPERLLDWTRKKAAATGWPIAEIWPSWVWLGVSVERQREADERIPILLETPAAVRFLSCEPLLEPLDLLEYVAPSALLRCIRHHQRTNHPCGGGGDTAECEGCGTVWENGEVGLHWIIVGGESGVGARPMQMAWARSLLAQCWEAQVPVFVKQLGRAWAQEQRVRDLHGGTMDDWPGDLRIREFPQQTRTPRQRRPQQEVLL